MSIAELERVVLQLKKQEQALQLRNDLAEAFDQVEVI